MVISLTCCGGCFCGRCFCGCCCRSCCGSSGSRSSGGGRSCSGRSGGCGCRFCCSGQLSYASIGFASFTLIKYIWEFVLCSSLLSHVENIFFNRSSVSDIIPCEWAVTWGAVVGISPSLVENTATVVFTATATARTINSEGWPGTTVWSSLWKRKVSTVALNIVWEQTLTENFRK